MFWEFDRSETDTPVMTKRSNILEFQNKWLNSQNNKVMSLSNSKRNNDYAE